MRRYEDLVQPGDRVVVTYDFAEGDRATYAGIALDVCNRKVLVLTPAGSCAWAPEADVAKAVRS